MKLLKTVPAAVMLAGGLLRLLAQWPMILYLPSWMTLPLPKNRSKGWLTQATPAQSGNTKSSSMTADSTLTGMVIPPPPVAVGQRQQHVVQ